MASDSLSRAGDDARLDHLQDEVQRLHRGFSLRSAFSLAFADISPIVAIFALQFIAAGLIAVIGFIVG